MLRLVMISCMVLATPAPAAPRLSAVKGQAEIRALRQQNNEALAARDLDGVTRLATDDFVMILGGGQLLQGAKAYRDFVAHAFDDPHPMLFVRTPDRIDIGAPEGAPVAAETGRWVGTTTDGSEVRITGRYLIHWAKQTGEWRIVSETYVTVNLDGAGR